MFKYRDGQETNLTKSEWLLISLFAVLIFLFSPAATAGTYEQYVVAQDVEVAVINGEIRFCERANLKGRICGREAKVFGKRFREIMDWWSPETYVQAYTGYSAEITRVEPTPDMRGIVIFYRL